MPKQPYTPNKEDLNEQKQRAREMSHEELVIAATHARSYSNSITDSNPLWDEEYQVKGEAEDTARILEDELKTRNGKL